MLLEKLSNRFQIAARMMTWAAISAGLLVPSAAMASGKPAGLPDFWNNAGFGLAVAAVPPLAILTGMWLSDMDDIPTSPRGTLRFSIGATNQSQAGGGADTMYLGLRTGSFFGNGMFGAEVNTELLNYGVTKQIKNEEIDYRLEALGALSLWRNFDFPKLDPKGKEQFIDARGILGLILLAGVEQVSEPGIGDENAMIGLPIVLRGYYMPFSILGLEAEAETLVNTESFYLVGSLCVFLNYGPVQMPLTVGLHYRVVTDGQDTLHLIGIALGGF
ncbi:MAG: hypothetical protein GXP49_03590 [Deltaproteobacteria bacterium]|nr:hypothetical protein [Deltaproteobacteria bacterium]